MSIELSGQSIGASLHQFNWIGGDQSPIYISPREKLAPIVRNNGAPTVKAAIIDMNNIIVEPVIFATKE